VAAKQARETLEGLSKDELVARAEALGIDGANKFTKVELIDEISRAAGTTDRGLLGRARDLLRGVVEKGLARSSPPPKMNGDTVSREPERAPDPEPPVPTVTLAEIYAGQGHLARAKAVVREVLRTNENDEAARAFLEKLEATPDDKKVDDPYARVGIEPEAFIEPPAPARADVPPMLDDAPFPQRYGVDECVAMAVDPTTVYVYWESRPATVERARRALRRSVDAPSKSVLRVLVVEPDAGGPRVSTRDFDVIDLELGEWFVRDLPAGSIVRAAIGLLANDRFVPLAHTPDIEAPHNTPSQALAHEVVTWSEGETKAASSRTPLPAIAREAGTLGLPPLPETPEDELGRGLSSAELARRGRIARARRAADADKDKGPGMGASDLLATPGSASWVQR
jgi:hypothetical protein